MSPVDLFAWSDGDLVKAKVTQCALARICGACGQSLGRPVAFVGTAAEVGRNAFHAPPLHTTCADDVRRALDDSWEVVQTGGFEFVRPGRDDEDRRPTFQPNSLL
ncbi:hypothetical protein [Nocardioides sp.]|uniref:hypothetical protein n=1 Tax=Nocardioides sp. TaxID=35761 RepID=UPI002B277835|nr:hypothetical protein [Nocardioides sp.]